MAERKWLVKVFEVNYYCDDCSKIPNPGCLLKFTGIIQPTNPYKYQHQCPFCEGIYYLGKRYPILIYEDCLDE